MLSDKISHSYRLCTLCYESSTSLPWQQDRRQHGRYNTGTLSKQLTKPTVQGIMSVNKCHLTGAEDNVTTMITLAYKLSTGAGAAGPIQTSAVPRW